MPCWITQFYLPSDRVDVPATSHPTPAEVIAKFNTSLLFRQSLFRVIFNSFVDAWLVWQVDPARVKLNKSRVLTKDCLRLMLKLAISLQNGTQHLIVQWVLVQVNLEALSCRNLSVG